MSLIPKIFKKLTRSKPRPVKVSPEDAERIEKVRNARYTYLSVARLGSIVATIRRIEKEQVPGDLLEAGCALGGSAILIAGAKADERVLRVYDVFGMIPEPTDQDGEDVHARYEVIKSGQSQGIGDDLYYGYEDDLYKKVSNSFAEMGIDREKQNVNLIKGLVQDTLVVDGPVAMAHIDVDWYDPVMTCLDRIVPHLSVGGVIILDDYSDWSGCREATDAYFADKRSGFEFETVSGALRITRKN